jgi:4-hydroxybenzoate polyprenyltransferase
VTAEQQRTEARTVGGFRDAALAVLQSLRPKQWTKNFIVFAALIFDDHLFEPARIGLVVGAFICFCLASSTVYLVNDVLDRESDRLHPDKRNRPIASGRLNERLAILVAVTLLLVSTLGAFALRPAFAAIIVLYLALLVAYSFSLKHFVILDVFTIAGGFVLRAAGGAVVLNAPISPWLYVCTVLLALFLGFGKRRNELNVLDQVAGAHRRNLDEYSVPLLDQLILITSAATVMAYSLYTFLAPNLPDNHAMMLTIPVVLYGLFRYLYLLYVRGEGGAPEQLLLTDRPLLATVGVWAAMAVAVLYGPL